MDTSEDGDTNNNNNNNNLQTNNNNNNNSTTQQQQQQQQQQTQIQVIPGQGGGEQKQQVLSLAQFEIVRTLANTNLGKVKLAKERKSGKTCVLKYSSLRLMQQRQCNEDPQEEVAMLRYLSEPPQNMLNNKDPRIYIVQLWGEFYHTAADGSRYHFSVMEHVSGGEFYSYVNHHLESGEKISEELSRYFFHQLLLGVYYIHSKGVAHLDLKMENILLTNQYELKVCDFGVAQRLQALTAAQRQNSAYPGEKYGRIFGQRGTIPYMAPELFGSHPEGYDAHACDVYSLGVILFILLCGIPPYEVPATADERFKMIYNGQLLSLLDSWGISVSVNAGDLMQRILCPVQKRLTLTQVLTHPWFKDKLGNDQANNNNNNNNNTASTEVKTN